MAEATEATAATPEAPDDAGGTGAGRDPARWRRDVVIGGGIILIGLVGAYLLLGKSYYETKLSDDVAFGGDDELIAEAAWDRTKATLLWSYLAFAIAGTGALTAALLWPRLVAHSLAAGFGVVYLASGVMILTGGRIPMVVGVFQAAIGALMLRLAWSSWKDKDRAAWAFLLSLSAVLALAMLFGAPRIKAAAGAPGLWWVLIVPAVLLAQAVALYGARRDYA